MMQLIKKSTTLSAIISGVLVALPAMAQTGVNNTLLNQVQDESGLNGSRNLSQIIGSFINVLLTVLGVVLLILIIWSGIQWMTAGGNTEAVQAAKQRLINAVIGLVLVMSALAISNFVFAALNAAVDGGTFTG